MRQSLTPPHLRLQFSQLALQRLDAIRVNAVLFNAHGAA
jgi:hypothetical protein